LHARSCSRQQQQRRPPPTFFAAFAAFAAAFWAFSSALLINSWSTPSAPSTILGRLLRRDGLCNRLWLLLQQRSLLLEEEEDVRRDP
jgi:hypothetical protein